MISPSSKLLVVLTLFATFATNTYGQTSNQQSQSKPLSAPQTSPTNNPEKRVHKTADIHKIQLTTTVRGSQEQPKVLTIVPWQLPVYSKIEGRAPVTTQLPQLKPLYRASFVNEQKVYQKLIK
jgi:hypothetical protein